MRMYQDGVEVSILPDTARCKLSCTSPLETEGCPNGEEFCSGDCFYYTEDPEDAKVLDNSLKCLNCDETMSVEDCRHCPLRSEET